MTTSQATPRSLTQMLRDADDGEVRDLLLARPDLAEPRPTSYSQIASRATTRESVRRMLDRLNALDLWVVQQAGVLPPPVSPADITGVDADTASAALERLRARALLWGDREGLRPVRALATELARSPLTEPPALVPPSFDDAARRDPGRVDDVAAGSAFALVRRLDVLAEHTDHSPLRLRADGGLAQRESRQLGTLLDLPVSVSVLHVQIARAAGLLGVVADGRTELLVPTADFDTWQQWSLAEQWAHAALGWRECHPPSGSARLKRLAFEAFGPAGDARVLDAQDLRSWLAWHLPRCVDDAVRRATLMLDQASWIGVTGLGAKSSFGSGEDLTGLERLLPARDDTVLVQNDLTAVAPAPLTAQAAQDLGALADVESRGGATVYRFSVESLRRAHGFGWSPAEMTAVITARSRTPIPQPLSYLITDLERGSTPTADTGQSLNGTRFPGRPAHRRPRRAPSGSLTSTDDDDRLDLEAAESIVSALRTAAGKVDPVEGDGVPSLEGMSDSPLETLREAVETGELVWLGYVDSLGVAAERLVYAAAVEEGQLRATDNRTSAPVVLPIRRITAAHIIRGGSV